MHSPTLIITAAIFAALITGVLYAVLCFNRDIPGLRLWVWSFFAASLTAINLLLSDLLPEVLSVIFAQGSIAAATTVCWLGSRSYMGLKPLPRRWLSVIGLVVVLLLGLSIYFTTVSLNPGARFVLASGYSGVFFLLTARTVAKGDIRLVPARYLFASIVGIHGLFLFIRPVLFKLSQPSVIDGADSAFMDLISQFVVLEANVAVVATAFGVLVLANEHITTALRRLAEIDPLTQVFNRRAFLLLLDKAISSSQRTHALLPVLLIDLDHFKTINDTWGHRAGDDVLRHFVQLANRCLRKDDVMGRLGGEEFAIFLPNADGPGAAAVAEHVRALVEAQSLKGAVADCAEIRLTVSIGVVLYAAGESGDTVLHRADEAMYLAKQHGRNRVEWLAGGDVACASHNKAAAGIESCI